MNYPLQPAGIKPIHNGIMSANYLLNSMFAPLNILKYKSQRKSHKMEKRDVFGSKDLQIEIIERSEFCR